jgi:ABC-2 type transport system permease protein
MSTSSVTYATNDRPSLARLTAVELRKMVNTRSGFWVMLGVAAVTVALALVNGLANGGREATYTHVFHDTLLPAAYLLPLLGVLAICGEWTQRTTLNTFTLVPVRPRVLAAKALACLLVTTAALVVVLVASVSLTAAFGHAHGGAGTLPLAVVAQGWVDLAGWMLIGLAFGAALLNTAPAIVAYLILPNAWNAVGGTIHSLSGVATWLSASKSTAPLTMHPFDASEWAQVMATLAVWVVVPLLVGARRLQGDIS